MKKIKFSHWYFKLASVYDRNQSGKKARLLQAIKIHYNDLSKGLIEYDSIHEDGYYPLPKTELILLVFNANQYTGGVFTTIRRYTIGKWGYYKGSEGEIFEVVVEG